MELYSAEKIRSLFGGREAFEALPVIDIGRRQGFTDLIDFIKPEEMSAPIMRGTDKRGRNFFTISYKDKNENYNCKLFLKNMLGVIPGLTQAVGLYNLREILLNLGK